MLTIALILLAILGILTICGFGYIVTTILSVIGPVILIYLGVKGLDFIKIRHLEKYGETLAGLAITLCGVLMITMGI